jgi:hypothetical protein
MSKLPFVARIFFVVLAIVTVAAIVICVIAKKVFDYGPLQPQDWVGTVISTILFSYLVHLWMLPMPGHDHDGDAPRDADDAE